MPNLNRLIEIARALEPNRPQDLNFHVCGIFRNNRLLSIGINRDKLHTGMSKYEYHKNLRGIHAEFDAVRKLPYETDFEKLSLAVLRIGRLGNVASSCPCRGCQSMINQLGLKRIYYTTDKGTWESVNRRDFPEYEQVKVKNWDVKDKSYEKSII